MKCFIFIYAKIIENKKSEQKFLFAYYIFKPIRLKNRK